MSVLLGMAWVFGAARVLSAQDDKDDKKVQETKMSGNKKKDPVMNTKEKNTKLVLDVFSAIERRDNQRFTELLHPDFEIHWPPSLPYGGTSRGLKVDHPTWSETWSPLQPTEAERKMDPRVVAASEEEVVVLWHQRGASPAGDRFDGEVIGVYQVREGKLARAQMFYFDSVVVVSFLAKAKGPATTPKP
jgi:ketosteroid isomerase-like protein